MASVSPHMPWKMKFKMYAKATVLALPTSILVVAEIRDMYYRATWDVVHVDAAKLQTGDVIVIANRWYTLPHWGQKLRSVLFKSVLKCTWDDVGVVVVRDGVPHIVMGDYDGVVDQSIESFIQERMPRGVALRKLTVEPGFPTPQSSVADMFTNEVKKIPVSPWYLFSASWRTGAEHAYYQYATEFHQLKAQYRSMLRRRGVAVNQHMVSDAGTQKKSGMAVSAMEKRLKEMEVMREHLAGRLTSSDSYPNWKRDFKLTNASLVSSFFATFDLMDRELPIVSRYVPQDFAFDLPMRGARLEPPIVIFKN
jgi:hypothetical protein